MCQLRILSTKCPGINYTFLRALQKKTIHQKFNKYGECHKKTMILFSTVKKKIGSHSLYSDSTRCLSDYKDSIACNVQNIQRIGCSQLFNMLRTILNGKIQLLWSYLTHFVSIRQISYLFHVKYLLKKYTFYLLLLKPTFIALAKSLHITYSPRWHNFVMNIFSCRVLGNV